MPVAVVEIRLCPAPRIARGGQHFARSRDVITAKSRDGEWCIGVVLDTSPRRIGIDNPFALRRPLHQKPRSAQRYLCRRFQVGIVPYYGGHRIPPGTQPRRQIHRLVVPMRSVASRGPLRREHAVYIKFIAVVCRNMHRKVPRTFCQFEYLAKMVDAIGIRGRTGHRDPPCGPWSRHQLRCDRRLPIARQHRLSDRNLHGKYECHTQQ